MDETLKEVVEAIKEHQSFLITSHLYPDGDAIGSQLALASLLEEIGKSVAIIDPHPVPDNFRFLPRVDKIHASRFTVHASEVALVLDCSNWDRVGEIADLARKARLIINIDHHMNNARFGNINLVEREASAVGEQIFSLISPLGCSIGEERAISLYTSILTDTGSFRYANTTERTHRIISSLLREGVEPASVAEKVYVNGSFSRQKLLGLVLAAIRKGSQGKIAWSRLTREMFEEAKAKGAETDGFIDYIRSIEGVELALLFREPVCMPRTCLRAPHRQAGRTEKKAQLRVSFRSNGKLDVESLARKFGGGGHQGAAGCYVEGTMDEVEKKVLVEARKMIKWMAF